eukprot:12866719-Ditylum_brightwellii.AAC.1
MNHSKDQGSGRAAGKLLTAKGDAQILGIMGDKVTFDSVQALCGQLPAGSDDRGSERGSDGLEEDLGALSGSERKYKSKVAPKEESGHLHPPQLECGYGAAT